MPFPLAIGYRDNGPQEIEISLKSPMLRGGKMLNLGASGGGHVSKKRFHTVLLDPTEGETGAQTMMGQ